MVDSAALKVPAKIPRIAVYLSEEVKSDLELLASARQRSLSQMAAIIIADRLKELKAEGKLTEPSEL
jgi:predicted transcriptional regulator